MATKKTTSTAVVPWEAEMAARAVKAATAETVRGGGIKKIGTRGGVLTVDDEPVEDNELRVIVLSAVHENQWYQTAFDPRKPTVPGCYSFGDPEAEKPEDSMAPHEEAEAPQGDANGLCAECWANQMGSADIGRGKACKNIRRLAVVTEDALESAEALTDAEVRVLNVPVMSTKNWAKFVNTVAEDMKRPPWGVICLLKVVPDAKSQFVVTFKFEELVTFDAELYAAMQKKVAEVTKELVTPYPKQADLDAANEQQQPVKAHGKLGQKLAGKAPGKAPTKPAAPAKAAGKARKF